MKTQQPKTFMAFTKSTLVWGCPFFLFGTSLLAADVDYQRVKSLLKSRCYACHGVLKQEAGLRLDAGKLIRAGGDSGPAILPKDGSGSLLVARISAEDAEERMPPEGKPLTKSEIALIKTWIDQGAMVPADDRPEADPRQHWSFVPPVRHNVPEVPIPSSNPIDRFVAARQQQAGTKLLGPATRSELLRRVYLDLIGVPPTREQLLRFLADESPFAYERAVDQLLERPQYGERWGRHWMDVWRYSDWYGRRQVNDVRNSYPHIWRWRDWIVRSLNRDKGYDQMIREMLAADELYPADDERMPALGFIVRNWFSLNYDVWKSDLVEHTGKAFLGLRLNCAKCHDHKYDPIAQQEYFQFRAFFEPVELRHDRVPGGPELTKYIRYRPGSGASLKPIAAGLPRVYDHDMKAETFMYRLGDARDRMNRPPVKPAAPAFLDGDKLDIEPIQLPAVAWYPGLKSFAQEAALATAKSDVLKSEPVAVQSSKRHQAAKESYAKLLRQRDELRAAQSKTNPAKWSAKQIKKLVGYWRFEKDAFLQDSSPFTRSLQPVVRNAPTPSQVASIESAGFPATLVDGIPNESAVRFEQTSGYGYLATKGDPSFYSETVSVEAFVHFEQSQRNFNRTIVSYPGSWSLIHRGLDEKNFEFRIRVFGEGDQLVDVSSSPDWVFPTSNDYYVCLQVSPNELVLWVANLSRGAGIRRRSWKLKSEAKEWSRLARPPATTGITIGNADGTGRVVGMMDEVRLSHELLPEAAIAAVIGQSPNAELRELQQQISAAQRELVRHERAAQLATVEREYRLKQLESVEARIAADNARFRLRIKSQGLIDVATKLESEVQQLKHQFEIAQAKQVLSQPKADAAKLKMARTQQTAAENALKKLKKDPPKTYTAFGPTYPEVSSGRRAALANWIANRKNPLTARVAVNHIWLRHFGRPLVESVMDFGRSGKQPTHPKLLDWLAVELMENGWRMKHIHRLIVTSRLYRATSSTSGAEHNKQIDKDNRTWWHFERRRLNAEAIRDSVLHLSESLDRRLGGQEIEPANKSDRRRSMYFAIHPEAGGVMPFVSLFDPPDPCDCYRRTRSIMPQQALALFNSELIERESREIAALVMEQADSTDGNSKIIAAFQHILSRDPNGRELEACRQFIHDQVRLYQSDSKIKDAQRRAMASLVRSLLNHHEFVTIK